MIRWSRATIVTLASIVIVTLVFVWFAWQRRWISDDGLIFVRIVNQIREGNGPVFNAFERTEANTSALWPWLLALVGAITRIRVSLLAVGLGMLLSVAGLVLALDGTRRWHRARGELGPLVPLSAFVVLAVSGFWDYASSGLETGLTTCWLGATWWLFVRLAGDPLTVRRQHAIAIVFGLGPLIRPDLGIASVVFLAGMWWLLRPPRRRTFALAGSAFALPIAYEIFRAGYYGILVPLPALAKGASGAEWHRGYMYLIDFIGPSWLLVPAGVCIALLLVAYGRGSVAPRDRVVIAVPVIAAVLLALYVLRVGGDFMHARMWLPATFIALAPGLLVPLRRIAIPAVILVLGWAAVTEHRLAARRVRSTSFYVEDERLGYVWWTKSPHPVSDAIYLQAAEPATTLVADAVREHRRAFVSEEGVSYAIGAHVPASIVFAAGRLGTGGMVTPVDGIVVDTLGLANPIGARIEVNRPDESPGHQKSLPWAWALADFGDPAHYGDSISVDPDEVRAAAHAMTCGELAELLASVREPMSISRFFANLVGSVRRSRLEIPSDPFDAETKFCGPQPPRVRVRMSSSLENFGWAKRFAIDGIKQFDGTRYGYSSEVWIKHDHPEWVAIELSAPRTIASVVLYPRTDPNKLGMGFPIDFTIDVWTGSTWVTRVTKTAFPRPDTPQTFSLGELISTTKVRISATKLQNVPADDYVMQFAEIELL